MTFKGRIVAIHYCVTRNMVHRSGLCDYRQEPKEISRKSKFGQSEFKSSNFSRRKRRKQKVRPVYENITFVSFIGKSLIRKHGAQTRNGQARSLNSENPNGD